MLSAVNEETIMPEKADATVTEEVEAVEEVEADATDTEIEETDNGEVEATAEAEPSESSTEKEEGAKDTVQKRIDDMTKARREAERDAEYWKQIAQQNQVAPEPVEPGKTLADFDYDEGKYAEYLTEFAKAEARAEVDKQLANERAATVHAEYSQKEAEFAQGVDDYHTAVTNPTLRFSPEMAAATQTGENGPALRYYLAKNPEISASLASMAPLDMARELGRIEATKLVKETAPKVSNAPKPVPKIAATSNKVTTDPLKMTDAQFAKWRQKQIANR